MIYFRIFFNFFGKKTLSGRCPEPCQGGFLKKAPLEPAKTFGKGQENGIKQAKTDYSQGSAPNPAKGAFFKKPPWNPKKLLKRGRRTG